MSSMDQERSMFKEGYDLFGDAGSTLKVRHVGLGDSLHVRGW